MSNSNALTQVSFPSILDPVVCLRLFTLQQPNEVGPFLEPFGS